MEDMLLSNYISEASKYTNELEIAWGVKHRKVLSAQRDLASLFFAAGMLVEAETILGALLQSQLIKPSDPFELGQTLRKLGEISFVQGRYPEAEAHFAQEISLLELYKEQANPLYETALCQLLWTYRQANNEVAARSVEGKLAALRKRKPESAA